MELTPKEDAEGRRALRTQLAELLLHTGHCHEASRHCAKMLEARDGLQPPKGSERLAVLCMLGDALMQVLHVVGFTCCHCATYEFAAKPCTAINDGHNPHALYIHACTLHTRMHTYTHA